MTSKSCKVNATEISLVRGDITRQDVGAIVNAANSSLLGGGGVDGAIHRAGGPAILDECKQILAIQGKCRAGEAVITGGGNLKAKFVIHTVGPIWRGGASNEEKTLASAYNQSLLLAEQYEVKTVAFPSISTGAYGFPIDKAARIAVAVAREFCSGHNSRGEIRFVLFDDRTYEFFKSALDE
ncbi:MAG: O-acetyl-ADP-ribose deacetylase [Candidatus Melainabacteria bacterium]|nr:O-acetyl-ADP-ribose deacetylase [Candidatus Melainabacteria bacterium]